MDCVNYDDDDDEDDIDVDTTTTIAQHPCHGEPSGAMVNPVALCTTVTEKLSVARMRYAARDISHMAQPPARRVCGVPCVSFPYV